MGPTGPGPTSSDHSFRHRPVAPSNNPVPPMSGLRLPSPFKLARQGLGGEHDRTHLPHHRRRGDPTLRAADEPVRQRWPRRHDRGVAVSEAAAAPEDGAAADGGQAAAAGSTAGGKRGGRDGSQIDPNAVDADPGTDNGPPPANAADVLRALRRATATMKVAGGSKYVLLAGDRQSAPPREVDAALSEPVRHAFVDPENWDGTRTAFRDQRLILL